MGQIPTRSARRVGQGALPGKPITELVNGRLAACGWRWKPPRLRRTFALFLAKCRRN